MEHYYSSTCRHEVRVIPINTLNYFKSPIRYNRWVYLKLWCYTSQSLVVLHCVNCSSLDYWYAHYSLKRIVYIPLNCSPSFLCMCVLVTDGLVLYISKRIYLCFVIKEMLVPKLRPYWLHQPTQRQCHYREIRQQRSEQLLQQRVVVKVVMKQLTHLPSNQPRCPWPHQHQL